MKLEAVVTCVNYGDFLAHTLPANKALFDRLVVITAPEDKHTRRVCEHWHVQCVMTDAFESRWDRFNKGKGINVGLGALEMSGSVVHMDADIALPPNARNLIEQANLDPSCLYGCDRFMVPSFEAWQRFITKPELQFENRSWIHLKPFPVGTRVTSERYGGYIPIGFFQLWNPAASGVKSYPDNHTDAGRTDMLFAAQWPRAKRNMLPEIIAYHLESEPAEMGANWAGRKTKPFCPDGGYE